jgi:hypothetical protein
MTGHDGVDVGVDVDAGFLFEFVAFFGVGFELAEALAEVGIHDLADVGVGDDCGIGGHILQFVRPGRP